MLLVIFGLFGIGLAAAVLFHGPAQIGDLVAANSRNQRSGEAVAMMFVGIGLGMFLGLLFGPFIAAFVATFEHFGRAWFLSIVCGGAIGGALFLWGGLASPSTK